MGLLDDIFNKATETVQAFVGDSTEIITRTTREKIIFLFEEKETEIRNLRATAKIAVLAGEEKCKEIDQLKGEVEKYKRVFKNNGIVNQFLKPPEDLLE